MIIQGPEKPRHAHFRALTQTREELTENIIPATTNNSSLPKHIKSNYCLSGKIMK